MRRTSLFLAIALSVLVPLAASAKTAGTGICPGTYKLSLETDITNLKNDNRSLSVLPLLSDPPPNLAAELSEDEKQAATYGVLILGPTRQRFLVALGAVKGPAVDFLYVDTNGDGTLAADEKVELKADSAFTNQGYEIQTTQSLKPVLCRVDYPLADGTIFTGEVAIKFYLIRYQATAKGSKPKYAYDYFVNSMFTGIADFTVGKSRKALDFAVLDGDDDGVFCDFGQDALIIDANEDGYFDMSKEIYSLTEFEDMGSGKETIQLRKALFAWPSVLVVQPSADPVDRAALEP